MDAHDDELLRSAAAAPQQKLSELLIESGRERAERLLGDRTRFVLSDGTGLFVSALPARLVHGDMYGGNVMIEVTRDGDVRPRLIDYRSVGPDPRAIDFAALDASLRLADVKAILRDFGVESENDLDQDQFPPRSYDPRHATAKNATWARTTGCRRG